MDKATNKVIVFLGGDRITKLEVRNRLNQNSKNMIK